MNYIRLPNGMSSTFYQPCISAAISFAKAARAAALLPLTADFTAFKRFYGLAHFFAGGGRPCSVINYRERLI